MYDSRVLRILPMATAYPHRYFFPSFTANIKRYRLSIISKNGSETDYLHFWLKSDDLGPAIPENLKRFLKIR